MTTLPDKRRKIVDKPAKDAGRTRGAGGQHSAKLGQK